MIYQVRINKRIRNERVYVINRRIGGSINILTRLFMKLFKVDQPKKADQSAGARLG